MNPIDRKAKRKAEEWYWKWKQEIPLRSGKPRNPMKELQATKMLIGIFFLLAILYLMVFVTSPPLLVFFFAGFYFSLGIVVGVYELRYLPFLKELIEERSTKK